jgi:hypothetical protein
MKKKLIYKLIPQVLKFCRQASTQQQKAILGTRKRRLRAGKRLTIGLCYYLHCFSLVVTDLLPSAEPLPLFITGAWQNTVSTIVLQLEQEHKK